MKSLLCRSPVLLLALALLLPSVASAREKLPEQTTGSSNLWQISGPDGQTGYLLGTIHSEEARVLEFPPELLAALGASEIFAMELVPNLPTLTELTGLMQYQGDGRLSDELEPELYAQVVSRLRAYGMVEPMVAKLRPWAVAMTLSVPPPETGMFMDFTLSLRAAAEGLQVVALETLEEQVGFLENMGLELQLMMIRSALEDMDKMQHQYQRMIEAYLEGDPEYLWQLAFEEMSQMSPELTKYFIDQGIDARNQRMLERLQAQLQQGVVFAAVGALHLPRQVGLIHLLREAGYTVTPLATSR